MFTHGSHIFTHVQQMFRWQFVHNVEIWFEMVLSQWLHHCVSAVPLLQRSCNSVATERHVFISKLLYLHCIYNAVTMLWTCCGALSLYILSRLGVNKYYYWTCNGDAAALQLQCSGLCLQWYRNASLIHDKSNCKSQLAYANKSIKNSSPMDEFCSKHWRYNRHAPLLHLQHDNIPCNYPRFIHHKCISVEIAGNVTSPLIPYNHSYGIYGSFTSIWSCLSKQWQLCIKGEDVSNSTCTCTLQPLSKEVQGIVK